MSLSVKQRRALAMLATAGRNGATQPLLTRNMRGSELRPPPIVNAIPPSHECCFG